MSNTKRGESTTTDPANDLEPAETAFETIFVVSRRTGLPMATLRAWERRYGFPRPERKPGSNRRLYSTGEIERLLWIKRALESGYRVGDVVGKTVEELKGLSNVGAAPVAAAPMAIGRAPSPPELLSLVARDDVADLEDELRRAGATLGHRRFVTDVAHPLAVLVGQAWATGRISIRHEHVATECLLTRLRALLAGYQDVDGAPRVLLATLPGEPHGLALQMVGLYLVTSGAKVRILGVQSPVDEIVEASRALAADVVGLTLTPVLDVPTTRRSVLLLRSRLAAAVPLWLGGSGASMIGPVDEGIVIAADWDDVDRAVSEWRRTSRPVHVRSHERR